MADDAKRWSERDVDNGDDLFEFINIYQRVFGEGLSKLLPNILEQTFFKMLDLRIPERSMISKW